MSDWRETVDESDEDDRPAFGTGQLNDGDKIDLIFETDGETFEGQYGESVRFDVVFLRSSRPTIEDLDENAIGEEERATLLTSSQRLLGALAGVSDNLIGEEVRIHKEGSGMDVQYTAELIE